MPLERRLEVYLGSKVEAAAFLRYSSIIIQEEEEN